MSVELVDQNLQLPIAYRNTIANMMAEAEAQNGIFASDELTVSWYRQKGLADLPYPPVRPGADATYAIDETVDLSSVRPMIAKPFRQPELATRLQSLLEGRVDASTGKGRSA
jgi:aconitase A